jgi:hypothetical protein
MAKQQRRHEPTFKAVYAVTVIVLVALAVLVFLMIFPPWYGW